MENPSAFMFFGSPRNKTQSFDPIFNSARTPSTLFHRLITFFPGVEGDVAMSLALFNAYSLACRKDSARLLKKAAKNARVYDGNLFRKKKVQEYMSLLDTHCRTRLESLFNEFQIHSNPIISVSDMQTFINQAPAIFGDTWQFLCDLHGVKPNQKKREETGY